MSRIATNPSPVRTWSPSPTRRQNRQSSGSDDPLLCDRSAADAYERADGSVDEPGRIVVAVAAPRPVDEHGVLASDLGLPAGAARGVRGRSQTAAALLLH